VAKYQGDEVLFIDPQGIIKKYKNEGNYKPRTKRLYNLKISIYSRNYDLVTLENSPNPTV
jgi:hypothetical protein